MRSFIFVVFFFEGVNESFEGQLAFSFNFFRLLKYLFRVKVLKHEQQQKCRERIDSMQETSFTDINAA